MQPLRVGIIGAGWMGRVHARAYQRVAHHWPHLPIAPQVVALAEPSPQATADFTARHGEVTVVADWRELLASPWLDTIDAVSVTAPNALHREIGVAVARAGKHLWIEKPVGLSAGDAIAVRDAVRAAGVVGCVGFNYRAVPAVTEAARLIAQGAIGTPTHGRIALLTDYAAHPGSPLSWRFERERGGHGVLGDLASHAVDLARFLLGDIDALVARTSTSITQRPVIASTGHYEVADLSDPSLVMGDVGNEDHVVAILEMADGALVTCECDRAAVGEQNAYGFELHGTRGLVRWDFRRPGELHVSSGGDYAAQPTTRVLAGPGMGEYAAFQPGAGITMGYDDTKVIECAAFLRAIAGESATQPTLDDAVASAQALDAMVASQERAGWIRLPR